MSQTLDARDWIALVTRVFRPEARDQRLAFVTDLPDTVRPDHEIWRARREMVQAWHQALAARADELGMTVALFVYPNVHANNADLPDTLWRVDDGRVPARADGIETNATPVATASFLADTDLIIAATELSATAPLKIAGRSGSFRAATMPGFTAEMIPALKLDYTSINRRVHLMKELVDAATGAEIEFHVDGDERLTLHLDLRHRQGHASGGLFPDPGMVGNLPSGETYIVPYEGERDGDPSRSQGELPVQHPDGLVIYTIAENRAVDARGEGAAAAREAALIQDEPAYANLAELGLGVLADYGLTPTGSILLDEKLGLHIAFGRSDHFGGQVASRHFSRPDRVVHIDRVYLPALQPRVRVARVDVLLSEDRRVPLMRNDVYVVDWSRDSLL
jgi:leucyl aminopeptidase (aminopeptidase T)